MDGGVKKKFRGSIISPGGLKHFSRSSQSDGLVPKQQQWKHLVLFPADLAGYLICVELVEKN